MVDGAEPLYEQMAESISECVPEKWSVAKMEAVFFDDSITYLGEYQRAADGVSRSFPTDIRGERAFRQLRQLFKDAAKPLWGQACFEMQSDGKFRINFGYDDCDEDGNTRFDEERELRRAEERRLRLTAE